jgi:hypothetical protein
MMANGNYEHLPQAVDGPGIGRTSSRARVPELHLQNLPLDLRAARILDGTGTLAAEWCSCRAC